MKLLLSRAYQKNETLSSAFVLAGQEVKYRCKVIELPNLGNQHNISCIPEGTYDCVKENHPTKGMVFRVLNVPGRDGILIHKGNFVNGNKRDSLGCLIPGEYFDDINKDGFLDIGGSTKALTALMEILPDKFQIVII